MSSRGVALILGAGPRVGAAVAESLARKGYSIAIVSRKGTGSKNDQGYLSLSADFTKPETIAPIFEAVKKEYKTAPSVVVYNSAGLTPPSDSNSVLSVPAANFASDLNLNVLTPYVAAQEAVKGFETLPQETKKTFIFTGNILNTVVLPVPMMLTLGVGKAAAAYWVGVADANYSARGWRSVVDLLLKHVRSLC